MCRYLHPLEAAAVASGFGWYSLSGVLIAETYDVLGALAFLANVFQKIIAIVLIPIVAAGSTPAGSCTGRRHNHGRDAAIISKHTSAQVTLIAFYSGSPLLCLSSNLP